MPSNHTSNWEELTECRRCGHASPRPSESKTDSWNKSNDGQRVDHFWILISLCLATDLKAERAIGEGGIGATEKRHGFGQVDGVPGEVLQVVWREEVRGRLSRVVHIVILQQLREKKKFKVRCIQTYPKDLRWTELVLTRLKTTALLYIKLLSGSTFRLPLVLRATNSGQFTWDTKHTQGQNIMNSHVTVTHISTLGCQECYKQQKLLSKMYLLQFIYFNF